MRLSFVFPVLLSAAALSLVACESDDPVDTPPVSNGGSAGQAAAGAAGSGAGGAAAGTGGSGGAAAGTGGSAGAAAGTGGAAGTDAGGAAGAGGGVVEPLPLSCDPGAGTANRDTATCTPAATAYKPLDSANDTWPACSSDGTGVLTPFDVNISTNARIAAFEAMKPILGIFTDKVPTPDDFLAARVKYQEAEGLESRVSRREDEHYPALAKQCRDLTPEEQKANPDRCVGPAQIQPLINQAFLDGNAGTNPTLAAARIEAAFIWFAYASTYKEAVTCTNTKADCDSSTAYYAGSQSRTNSLGWSSIVQANAPKTHEAVWDGLQAVHCWREADSGAAATDLATRDKALGQLDSALDRALAVTVRQRISQAACGRSWETARILGKVLNRAAAKKDAAQAAILATEIAKEDGTKVDTAAAIAALDALFPCP